MSEVTGTRPGGYKTPAKDDAERALFGELRDDPADGTVDVPLSERLRERRTQGRSRTHQAAPPPPPGDSAPPPPPPPPPHVTVSDEDIERSESVIQKCAAGDYTPNDAGNSDILRDLWGKDYRWSVNAPGSGWMVWDGNRWKPDHALQIRKHARHVANIWKSAAPPPPTLDMEAEERKVIEAQRKRMLAMSLRCGEARSVRSMVEMMQPHLPVAMTDFDSAATDWLFNVPGATLNLAPNIWKSQRPERSDYITKMGGAAPADSGDCPVWKGFLNRIMGGDAEIIAFLQRAIGYCLVGDNQSAGMFVAYGSGANGKSTFIQALSHVFGDYVRPAAADTFLSTKDKSAIPNDLAGLVGARVIICSETNDGDGLDEARVKQMTGGDKISVRFLGKEFFEFTSKAKIWLPTNHKPIIRGTDHGIWRRIFMIPFEVTIPDSEQDRQLGNKLEAEVAEITRWAIDGLYEYHMLQASCGKGLAAPESVKAATDAYRQDMDVIGEFIADACLTGAGYRISNTLMYRAYETWASDNGLKAKSHKAFSRSMMERGYTQAATRGADGRLWSGITTR